MYRKAEVGDVIQSRAFAHGSSSNGGAGRPPIYLVGSGKGESSRGGAWYVVEEASEQVIESLGRSWRVEARRLKSDGTYDPQGERISFYQDDGIYSWNMVRRSQINLIGKMSVRFVWQRRLRAA